MGLNFENDEKRMQEKTKNMRKIILIENIDELGLKGKRKERFVNYYYNNLDLNLLEALDKFKSNK